MRLSFDAVVMVGCTLFASACAPQGEWNRVTHPPHQAYLAQMIPSQKRSLGGGAETFQRGLPGLPDICSQNRMTPGEICLECRSEVWLVQRCFSYPGKFESDASCLSTQDHIKCLLNNPATSINLSFKRSIERQFRENFLVWQEKILEIWSGRLSTDEEKALQSLLHLSSELSLWLSQKDPKLMQENDWNGLLPLTPAELHSAYPHCQKTILELQAQRLRGDLSLLIFLREVKNLLTELKLNPQLIEYLEALSLEGLEEGI